MTGIVSSIIIAIVAVLAWYGGHAQGVKRGYWEGLVDAAHSDPPCRP